jgi:hypothetical protein
MKKISGVILSFVFTAILFGVLIYFFGLMPTLIAVGITALIVGAVFLCVWCLTDDK